MRKHRTVTRLIRKVLKILVFSIILIALIRFGIYVILEYQDQNYAGKYFGFMNYESTLESRRWHSEVLGCTYAIVALPEKAPVQPPTQWLKEIAWYDTPMIFQDEAKTRYCHNLICECESDWDPSSMNLLEKALSNPGSFYYFHKHRPPHSSMGQGVIFIYSKPEKVAAMVRFGD